MLSLCVIGAAGSTIHCPRRPELVMEAHLPRLQSAIEAFHARCGQLPVQPDDLLPSRDSTGCHGPQRMTPSALRDYWGQPFVYAVTSAGHEFRLLSIGADRRPGTADDIVLGDTHKPWRPSYRPPFEWRRVPVQLAILLLLGMVVRAVVLTGRWLVRRLRSVWHSRRRG